MVEIHRQCNPPWDKETGFIRVVNHIDLAFSGYTPQIIIPSHHFNLPQKLSTFPVEAVSGQTWEQLISDKTLNPLIHTKIALICLEQLHEIYKKYGLLIMDRNSSNIIVEVKTSGNLKVTQVDLESVYDKNLGGDRMDYIPDAEGLIVGHFLEVNPIMATLGDILLNVCDAVKEQLSPRSISNYLDRQPSSFEDAEETIRNLQTQLSTVQQSC